MTQPDRLTRPVVACLALALGCSSGGSSGAPPIDPTAPDEVAFQAALAHYDAGTAAQAAARNPAEPDPAGKNAFAVGEFTSAQAGFHQLLVTYPSSPRTDNAAYLEGRSRYETATITGLRSDFQEAWTLLQSAMAAHPSSPLMDSMAYFAGRSLFRTAEWDRAQPSADPAALQAAVAQEYLDARTQFTRSIAANPGAPWGDNAAYYLGRCDYEVGFLEAHPLDPLAVPGTDPARLDLAEAELALVPASSTYYDNARYYLGRSFFEEPAATAADRQTNLASSVSAFTTVIGLPGPSSYALSATYWRGRAHYALAFQLGSGGAVDQPELELALADMKAVAPTTSVYADNAFFYVAKAYLNLAAPGPYCTAPRSADPAPASACAARAELAGAFPASGYLGQTDTYLAANGCTCP